MKGLHRDILDRIGQGEQEETPGCSSGVEHVRVAAGALGEKGQAFGRVGPGKLIEQTSDVCYLFQLSLLFLRRSIFITSVKP